LSHDGTILSLVTARGNDGCARADPTCGIDAFPMASFARHVLGASSALEMDQGGSTTMWLASDGIVEPVHRGARKLFSGLFLVKTA
jgi:hypothetical protein